MDDAELSRRLDAIEQRLAAIETRLPSEDDRTQALEDLLDISGVMGQVRQVVTTLRDNIATHTDTHTHEWRDIQETLLQLRELGRKHVVALADLERTIYGGVLPEEHARLRAARTMGRAVGDEERG